MPKELVAHGKTRREIAQHISADEVIFQSLEDLQAACIEAAEGESKVKGFEVGVFCGKYITDVPEGYFDHLSRLRGKKGKKTAVVTEEEETGASAVLIANSGPVNVVLGQQRLEDDGAVRNGVKSPQYREDIRYVISDYILISRLLISNTFIVFITSQARFQCTKNKMSFHVPQILEMPLRATCFGLIQVAAFTTHVLKSAFSISYAY